MLGRLFSGRQRKEIASPEVPAEHRVYAIGDIHGRVDLLRRLHDMILDDARDAAPERRTVVYLGDYIDRGMHSREVIDLLLDEPLPDFERVHLLGNHEEFVLEFASNLRSAHVWLINGGDTTLHSYGVDVPAIVHRDQDLEGARDDFFARIPSSHMAFLRGLRLYYEIGDYFFVHAGVRPGVPLERQNPADLVWIRDEFLNSDADFGKIVVHGHTIGREVEERANRIGIDTGAYRSGVLSCLVLQGTGRSVLQT